MPRLSERVERLIRMYLKYKMAGDHVQAARTLERIKEVGGYLAWDKAVRTFEEKDKL